MNVNVSRDTGAPPRRLSATQESYAPDESQAIEELAHGMAGALDVIQQKDASSNNAVASELRAVHAAIADGFASLRSLLGRGEGITG